MRGEGGGKVRPYMYFFIVCFMLVVGLVEGDDIVVYVWFSFLAQGGGERCGNGAFGHIAGGRVLPRKRVRPRLLPTVTARAIRSRRKRFVLS